MKPRVIFFTIIYIQITIKNQKFTFSNKKIPFSFRTFSFQTGKWSYYTSVSRCIIGHNPTAIALRNCLRACQKWDKIGSSNGQRSTKGFQPENHCRWSENNTYHPNSRAPKSSLPWAFGRQWLTRKKSELQLELVNECNNERLNSQQLPDISAHTARLFSNIARATYEYRISASGKLALTIGLFELVIDISFPAKGTQVSIYSYITLWHARSSTQGTFSSAVTIIVVRITSYDEIYGCKRSA